MAIEAGCIDRLVEISKPTNPPVRDETGGLVPSWTMIARTWAEILPVSTRDWIASNAENNEISAVFMVRDHVVVLPTYRILDVEMGEFYKVQGVTPVRADRKKLLRCARFY
jgi:head-tail adaptor